MDLNLSWIENDGNPVIESERGEEVVYMKDETEEKKKKNNTVNQSPAKERVGPNPNGQKNKILYEWR